MKDILTAALISLLILAIFALFIIITYLIHLIPAPYKSIVIFFLMFWFITWGCLKINKMPKINI